MDKITEFIKSFDEELIVSFKEEEGNCYWTAENRINIVLTETEDCGFLRHLKEVHNCSFAYDYPLILWTILHEVGHHETEYYIEEDYDEQEERFWLSLTTEDLKYNTTIQDRYFNLTSEWYATEWAIQWISENSEKAKKLSKMF